MSRQKNNNISCTGCMIVFAVLLCLFFLSKGLGAMIIPVAIIAAIIINVVSKVEKEKREHDAYLATQAEKLHHAIQLANDGCSILTSTTSVETALTQYQFVLDHLQFMESVTEEEWSFAGLNPVNDISKQIADFKQSKDDMMNAAILRGFTDMVNKAKSLKTEAGRANRTKAFYEKTRSIPGLSKRNLEYLQNLCIQNPSSINTLKSVK